MSTVAPARTAAYRTIRRVFEQEAYADRALRGELESLSARDRALATNLVYGTVQRQATLDHVIARLSSRPPEKLDPPVLAALRLGLYGLLFLDRTAVHATVNDSVELASQTGRGGAGLVNAVLRRAVGEGPEILAELSDATAAQAAVRHSVPEWLAAMWFDELGPDSARALLAACLAPAEAALRINTLVAEPGQIASQLAVASHPVPGLSEGLVLDGPLDIHGSELFAAGAVIPQSRASMVVARAVDPHPGERVLDLCAAPGGKTTHLAALAGDRAEIVAVERHAGRAGALASTCERMRATSVRVEVADAVAFTTALEFDRVLVDPPCSGLGTLRSRPDLRWRVTSDQIAELAAIQTTILDAAAAATAPGGMLVYSVCTIARAEGPENVAAFLARHPDFLAEPLDLAPAVRSDPSAAPFIQTRPDLDGTDGFFIARLRRARG